VATDNRCYVGVGLDPEHEEDVGHLRCTDLVTATHLGPENKDNDVSPRADCLDPTAAVDKDSSLACHYRGRPSRPTTNCLAAVTIAAER
jgi:hypothetical protein